MDQSLFTRRVRLGVLTTPSHTPTQDIEEYLLHNLSTIATWGSFPILLFTLSFESSIFIYFIIGIIITRLVIKFILKGLHSHLGRTATVLLIFPLVSLTCTLIQPLAAASIVQLAYLILFLLSNTACKAKTPFLIVASGFILLTSSAHYWIEPWVVLQYPIFYNLYFFVEGMLLLFVVFNAYHKFIRNNQAELRQYQNDVNFTLKHLEVAPWRYSFLNSTFLISSRYREIMGLEQGSSPDIEEDLIKKLPTRFHFQVQKAYQQPEEGMVLDFTFSQIKAKKKLHYHLRAEVFYNEQGLPEELVGSIEDVTERTEQAFTAAFEEALLTNTMESHVNGMLVINNAGIIRRFNSKFLEMFSLKGEQICNQPLTKVIQQHPVSPVRPADILQDVKRIGKQMDIEIMREFELSDGRFIEVHSLPHYFQGGQAGRILYFRDVTESRIKNVLLKNSEEKYKALFESSADGILVLDLEKRKAVDCNHQMLYLFQANRQEILEANTLTFSPKYQPDGTLSKQRREEYFSLNIENLSMKRFDWQYQNKNGRCFDAEVIVSPFYLQGTPMAIHIIRDISKRTALREALKLKNNELEAKVMERTLHLKESNDRLKRSNDDLEQFAFAASHDLKEPLRMVGNFVGLLARDYQDQLDEKAHVYMNFVTDGVKRMTDLMKGLLEFSLMGRSDIEMVCVDLHALLATKILDLSLYLEERKAIIHMPEESINMRCEPVMIGILFHNLITNAIKFNTSVRPELWIEYERREKLISFQLRDNGIGISEENQQKIFEIFTRLNRPNQFEGTGIGLAMCRKIVERHGGKIWVESKLGEGSIFHIELPVLQESIGATMVV